MKIEIIIPHELQGRMMEITIDVSRILKRLGREMLRAGETGITIGKVYKGDLVSIRFVY